MKPTPTHILITTTCDTPALAKVMAGKLVKAKLAACVQVSTIESHYMWKGRMAKAKEYRLTIKTSAKLLDKVEAFIKANHSYECPQIVALPMLAASREYLEWMTGELG